MSHFNRDGPTFGRNARKLLHDRLQREEMGDEAYDRMIANNGERGFKVFGAIFIACAGLAVLAITMLGW